MKTLLILLIVAVAAAQIDACVHGDFYPHQDCTKYYQCANGILYAKNCNPGLHWNNRLKTCDYPSNAGCA